MVGFKFFLPAFSFRLEEISPHDLWRYLLRRVGEGRGGEGRALRLHGSVASRVHFLYIVQTGLCPGVISNQGPFTSFDDTLPSESPVPSSAVWPNPLPQGAYSFHALMLAVRFDVAVFQKKQSVPRQGWF